MSFQTLEAVATRRSVVRVDLLPQEVAAARGGRLLRAGLGAGLVAVVGVACAAYAVTAGHVSTATDALTTEQQRTSQLQQEQRRYADVPKVMAQLQTARDVQKEVTSGDVPTYLLLDQLASRSPADLALTAVNITVAGASTSSTASSTASSAATPASDPLAVTGIGTVSVTGQTHSQGQVASFMDAVAALDGLADPRLTGSTLDPATGLITFTTTATLTDDATSSAG
ncbi:hypothetical protein [Kineococcus aurantiacus]|uniref:Tfp pilus assembly protein PilN n=1 Tax=Kineococcus aurantiacus TaxID=37633 RepID=A0A7Y9DGY9_9ACTN|nr:hypothetical protein [Kineococcus aurantiacus]NYD20816.1 Tfp pilus assembly protein PilN [Kineococcus aurantiacus]